MYDGTVRGEKLMEWKKFQLQYLVDTNYKRAISFFIPWLVQNTMDLVPVLSCGNNSKKYDNKIWWEDWNNIVEVNGTPVNETMKSSIKSGDTVLVKFGAKKLYKGIVELEDKLVTHGSSQEETSISSSKKLKFSSIASQEETSISSSKKLKLSSPVKRKVKQVRKGLPETKS